VIQVDIRGEQLGRRTIDVGLVGGVKETANALLPLLQGERSSKHLDESVAHYRKTRERLDDLAVDDGKAPVRPEYVARVLDELADADAVHRRRRKPRDLGRPLSAHERHAPADRLVRARIDGQRDAAGARGAGRRPLAPGDRARRRRRAGDAAGRSAVDPPERPAGEDRRRSTTRRSTSSSSR
jgi:hypothetical protein